ncbi:MAG: AAA family ATPase, partial [Bifidobacteriaceae bacterium]|nr:AAA family ATPase [Bifidobacteriaceae bacterium]
MNSTAPLIRRQVLDVARERVATSPVLLLQGPRSVGKSTVLRSLAQTLPGPIIDLDDPVVAADANANPSAFLPSSSRIYLDEYQRSPALLDAIKARLNTNSDPGQFILAGSTGYDALPAGVQALTGRIHRLPVYPLAQSEIDGTPGGLLAALFEDPRTAATSPLATGDRADYMRRISIGGFPLALRAWTPAARGRWFANYIEQTIRRDVPAVEAIR